MRTATLVFAVFVSGCTQTPGVVSDPPVEEVRVICKCDGEEVACTDPCDPSIVYVCPNGMQTNDPTLCRLPDAGIPDAGSEPDAGLPVIVQRFARMGTPNLDYPYPIGTNDGVVAEWYFPDDGVVRLTDAVVHVYGRDFLVWPPGGPEFRELTGQDILDRVAGCFLYAEIHNRTISEVVEPVVETGMSARLTFTGMDQLLADPSAGAAAEDIMLVCDFSSVPVHNGDPDYFRFVIERAADVRAVSDGAIVRTELLEFPAFEEPFVTIIPPGWGNSCMTLYDYNNDGRFLQSYCTAPRDASTVPTGNGLIQSTIPSHDIMYYKYGSDRYVFTDADVFDSWYANDCLACASSRRLPVDVMDDIPLRGSMTLRPGSAIKIESDPNVYVVDACKSARWVEDEATLVEIYGPDWGQKIVEVVRDVFFINYSIGVGITDASQVDLTALLNLSIEDELACTP